MLGPTVAVWGQAGGPLGLLLSVLQFCRCPRPRRDALQKAHWPPPSISAMTEGKQQALQPCAGTPSTARRAFVFHLGGWGTASGPIYPLENQLRNYKVLTELV